MDIAVIGACGACGRQLCMQLLERRIVPTTNRLQLVGHLGGASENELWGLQADMQDAFSEWAPRMQVVSILARSMPISSSMMAEQRISRTQARRWTGLRSRSLMRDLPLPRRGSRLP